MSFNIYMIRGGTFGFDFNIKLIITIVTLLICVYDWKTKKRLDYFYVFIVGTFFWACVEIVLQLAGTRVMGINYLFGLPIPLLISIPLQAVSEASFVAILGLFIADRLFLSKGKSLKIDRIAGLIAVVGLITLEVVEALFINGIVIPNVGGEVPSRRDMFTIPSITFLSIMVLIDIVWLIKTNKEFRKRGLLMIVGMLFIAISFTLGGWLSGNRWIEVGTPPTYIRAPPLIEFFALSYDVIIEIVLCYVPYLALPCIFRFIKYKDKNS